MRTGAGELNWVGQSLARGRYRVTALLGEGDKDKRPAEAPTPNKEGERSYEKKADYDKKGYGEKDYDTKDAARKAKEE